MGSQIPAAYRLPLWGGIDPKLKTTLGGSSVLGALFLAIAAFAPLQIIETKTVEDVPERFAKLILQEKKPAPTPPAPVRVDTPQLAEVVEAPKQPDPVPEPKVETKPKPRPIAETKDVGKRRKKVQETTKGQAGRDRARKEVQKSVAAATESVESTLENLSTDLAGIDSGGGAAKPSRRRGKSKVRRGRGATEVGGAVAQRSDVGSGEGLEGALVSTSQIDIEAITSADGDLASADPDFVAGRSDGGATGAYRSNASLIAVVRKYAAGIQFCYDNELKRTPGLDGKMVAVLTVLPSGRVSEASISKDTLGSPRLQSCVLTQIQEWKFPPIPEGTVTFRTPFVFTPPSH